jgi:inorganic pyrophosphatase
MSWRFWDRGASEGKGVKLPGPKPIPNSIGRALVVKRGEDPDWVWSLRCVERPRDGMKECWDIRVFDEHSASEKKISVRDYNSLEIAPELILFEGWYNKRTSEAAVVNRNHPSRG